VACDSALAASQHPGHAATVGREPVPDRIGGCVDTMEAPDRDPVPDRLLAQPDRAQLAPTDDTVLPRRKLRKLYVRVSTCQRFPL
jgi:hypothetical protein